MNSQLDHDSRYKEIRELFFTLPAEEQQNLINYARGLAEQMKAEQRERGTLILMGKGGAEPTANECLVIGVGVCPTPESVESMLRMEQSVKEAGKKISALIEQTGDLHPDTTPEPSTEAEPC